MPANIGMFLTDLASITAGWLVVYYLAGGIGSSIGGAIWTNIVPRKIDEYMEDASLRSMAYSNPIGFIRTYGPETAPRIALARAQDEAQVSASRRSAA